MNPGALIPRGERAAWFAAGMVLATAGFVTYQAFFAPPTVARTAPPRPTAAPLTVQVAGEVQQPGLYQLPGPGRVADALQLAGGTTEEADLDRVNQAARIADGQKLVVPRKGAPSADVSAVSGASRTGRLNLNTASLTELDGLPGVGLVTAQKIIEQRARAPFASPDQLVELKIVSGATFQRIQDLVTTE